MSNEIISFAQKKLSIASCLYQRQCGASYPEAVLIVSSTLSGIASLVWPGEGIDKKRFVELLVRYSSPDIKITFISIPLLVEHLRQAERDEAGILQSSFLSYPEFQVLTGEEADHTEEEIRQLCPELTTKEMREFSYANLLYKEVRSGFVHEYELKHPASPIPMTQSDAHISYFNGSGPGRSIYFHYEYLEALVNSVAASTQPFFDRFPIKSPATWWITGIETSQVQKSQTVAKKQRHIAAK